MDQFFGKSFLLNIAVLFAFCLLTSTSLEAKNLKSVESKSQEVEENEQTLLLVRGFVVDEFGEPMVGVMVNAMGSHKHAVTNTEGKYNIMASENDVLKFSQIGTIAKEEKITSSRIVNVALMLD